jgi:opacity protein-like surface antigen
MSAITFNPAGLMGIDRTQTALVYRYNRPAVRTRQFSAGSSGADIEYDNIDSYDQIDFGAVATPGKLLGRPVVAAFAYSVLADQFFADQAGFIGPANFGAASVVTEQLFSRQTSGKLTAFNLAAATRVGRFTFGATFNIYQGGFADTLNATYGPFLFNPGSASLVLGAQADYKKARIGGTVRVPSFKLGDTDLFRLKSNMDIGFYDSTFISGLPSLFASGGLLYFTDSRLELPLSVSGGLSYLLGNSLLVNFDYTYTNWGAADLKVRRIFQAPFSNEATLELGSAPVGLTSTHQLRFGWEYGFNPGFGRSFVRAGVRNLPVRTLTSLLPFAFVPEYVDSFVLDLKGNVIDTISTARLTYLNGDEDRTADGFGISGGLGIRWNQIALDFAYDYSTYQRTSRIQTLTQGIVTASRRQKQHRVFVGFTGYFTRM